MGVPTNLPTLVGPVTFVLSYSSGKWRNLARMAFNGTSNTHIFYCSVTLHLGSNLFFFFSREPFHSCWLAYYLGKKQHGKVNGMWPQELAKLA